MVEVQPAVDDRDDQCGIAGGVAPGFDRPDGTERCLLVDEVVGSGGLGGRGEREQERGRGRAAPHAKDTLQR